MGTDMNIIRLAGAALALFVLGACQSSDSSSAGEGSLHLAPAIADLFEKYKGEFIPYYFVVTTDGRRGSYTFCDNACRPFGSMTQALSGCETSNNAVPCRIFARSVNIVWGGLVTGLYNPETGSYDLRHE